MDTLNSLEMWHWVALGIANALILLAASVGVHRARSRGRSPAPWVGAWLFAAIPVTVVDLLFVPKLKDKVFAETESDPVTGMIAWYSAIMAVLAIAVLVAVCTSISRNSSGWLASVPLLVIAAPLTALVAGFFVFAAIFGLFASAGVQAAKQEYRESTTPGTYQNPIHVRDVGDHKPPFHWDAG